MQTFLNRVVHGDCINVLPEIPSGSFDLVVADPPYLVNYRPRDGGSNYFPNDDNDRWLKPSFREIFRTLKNDRLCVSFYGWTRAEFFLNAWKDAGFYPVGHLVWVKNYASKVRYVKSCHEQAYLLAKGRPILPENPPSDILRAGFTGNRFHPAEKPVEMIAELIQAFSEPGSVVLDPFTGSGTTAVAARRCGRSFVAIEKTSEFFSIAERRLGQATATSSSNAWQAPWPKEWSDGPHRNVIRP